MMITRIVRIPSVTMTLLTFVVKKHLISGQVSLRDLLRHFNKNIKKKNCYSKVSF